MYTTIARKVANKIPPITAPIVSRARRPIIVNSFGRSGSTVLYRSMTHSVVYGPSWLRSAQRRLVSSTAWDLKTAELTTGAIYKSHDYPLPYSREEDPLVLYVFGSPVNATLSLLRQFEVRGEKWMREHASHLGVPPFSSQDLESRDALAIDSHLDPGWINEEWTPRSFAMRLCGAMLIGSRTSLAFQSS